MSKDSLRPYFWMLAGSLAFAVMAALANGLSEDCPWQIVAIARSFLALAFAAFIGMASGASLVFWRPRMLWMRSIAGSISLVCTFYALARLPVSDVLTLTNTFPIWVALLAWPLYKERPTALVWLSAASGVAGVVIIQQPHFAEGNFATLVALGSSVTTAVAMLGLHQLQKVHPLAIVVHFSGVALCFCIAALFVFERTIALDQSFHAKALWMLLGVGVTATIGQFFLTRAFAFGAPTKVSVIGLTQIVFATLIDVVVWDRQIGLVTVVGMVLVAAPTAWLLLRRAKPEDDQSAILSEATEM